MTNQIQYQENLARRMLKLSSFVRLFSGNNYANSGMAKRGRVRTRRKAESYLIAQGYTERQARWIVRDSQDHAALLFVSEN